MTPPSSAAWAEERFSRRSFPRGRARMAERQLAALWSPLFRTRFEAASPEARCPAGGECSLQTLELGELLLSTFDFGERAQEIVLSPLHGQPGALLLVRMIRGGAAQTGESGRLPLPAGEVALIPVRAEGARLQLNAGGRCDIGLIRGCPSLPGGAVVPGGGVPSLHHLAFLAGYLLRCAPHPEGRSPRLKAMFLEALSHVVADINRGPVTLEETDLERFKFLVNANLARADLTLDDLARAMERSPRQLQRLLQSQGIRFRSYLLERRLAQARELIRSAGSLRPRIADLAYRCGFRDPNYFSRAYAHHWKTPPTRSPEGGAD